MSIETAHKEALKQLKKDARPNMPALAKRMRMPYNTIKSLVRGDSLGSIRTWLRIERFYSRQNKV
jgi:plasmid maintenance system antidote protein VapI